MLLAQLARKVDQCQPKVDAVIVLLCFWMVMALGTANTALNHGCWALTVALILPWGFRLTRVLWRDGINQR